MHLPPIPPLPRPTIRLTRENINRYRSDFARMQRRSAQLAWSSSAIEQRERAELQGPLMDLYRAFHPHTTYSEIDDFDAVVRGSRRTK